MFVWFHVPISIRSKMAVLQSTKTSANRRQAHTQTSDAGVRNSKPALTTEQITMPQGSRTFLQVDRCFDWVRSWTACQPRGKRELPAGRHLGVEPRLSPVMTQKSRPAIPGSSRASQTLQVSLTRGKQITGWSCLSPLLHEQWAGWSPARPDGQVEHSIFMCSG